ncbi:hypothetical protein CPAR01_08662 [Colletotrichum paranaense]|uniref:Uncharacterized protein n=1 Tax=Colletotrichum paranaense TaxID=1914294 RepID=A0ABQ9SKW3_9PEZI|nr:uncharacterized protein CPAR01_08662 [Colletotrichum paranaense]KAK1538549.1 hypothetical protein CPAR01_08662 [Colletotrichum paranaense]
MFLRLVAENEMEGPISFRQPPLPMYGYHPASPLAIIRATLLFRRRRGRRTSRRKHYFHTVTETQRQTLTQAQKGRADPEKGRHGPITPQIPYPNASGLVPPLRLPPHPVFWKFLEVPGGEMYADATTPQPWRQQPPPTPHEAIPVLVPAPAPAPRQPTSHASHTLIDFLAPFPLI